MKRNSNILFFTAKTFSTTGFSINGDMLVNLATAVSNGNISAFNSATSANDGYINYLQNQITEKNKEIAELKAQLAGNPLPPPPSDMELAEMLAGLVSDE